MIFLVLYPAAVWLAAHIYRRRWQGFMVAFLSVFPVIGFMAVMPDLLHISVERRAPAMVIVPGFYAALVAGGALFIAAQPLRPKHACIRCGYDLEGNTSGMCPECGEETARSAGHAQPRSPRPAKGKRPTV